MKKIKKNVNLEFFFNILEKIDDEIISFSYLNTNKKEDQWNLNRLQWRKNRIIFEKIFYEKIIPENYQKFLQKKKILDINLFRCWKTWKFRILCSTKVVQERRIFLAQNGLCRVPLLDRSLHSIYKVEPKSGCICCSTKGGLKEPIWWDNLNKISFFLRKAIEENASLSMTRTNFKKKNSGFSEIIQISRLKIIFQQKKFLPLPLDFEIKTFCFRTIKKKRGYLELPQNWKIFF